LARSSESVFFFALARLRETEVGVLGPSSVESWTKEVFAEFNMAVDVSGAGEPGTGVDIGVDVADLLLDGLGG